ncbi:hypothetical protein BD324DRAFT_630603 [Kockovaella imperatae]|uniref:Uncharacterized protein n=1 Tax=Kockovaella imperatae TaxID=4999 RepID=A0A1Y1UDC4_9TREE|nr:hypothetical protein BD324DRAFT_630603 [Kockovaella imperatae]ORX35547.1 hypothetical protein BD324DRAFT_630603 [Kockovaella imperatae]
MSLLRSPAPPAHMLRASMAARRALSSSPVPRQEVVTPAVGTVGSLPPPRRGGFRGGILGFLFGFSLAGSLALYYLNQEREVASGLLIASIDELQQSTGKITSHLDRLQQVEKEVASLKSSMAQRDDVVKVRGEMKKVYDGLHLELLDMRAHVWGVEQDLQKVVKTESIRI